MVSAVILGCAFPAVARADEPLHEGFMIRAGSGTQERHRVEASVDVNLLPLPGGGRLNGTHIAVSVGSDRAFGEVGLDRAQVQLLRWTHARLLGVRRDLDLGLPLGVDLGGLSMPLGLAGKKESRNWVIAHVGVDGDFNWYRESFGAGEDATGLGLTVSGRIDQQADLLERLSVRAWQKVGYRVMFGQFGAGAGLGVRQQLALQGAFGVYLDITPRPLYREIPRTNPVTGEVTYRRSVNQGLRWRWMIARVEACWQPVGYVTGLDRYLFAATGFERRF